MLAKSTVAWLSGDCLRKANKICYSESQKESNRSQICDKKKQLVWFSLHKELQFWWNKIFVGLKVRKAIGHHVKEIYIISTFLCVCFWLTVIAYEGKRCQFLDLAYVYESDG